MNRKKILSDIRSGKNKTFCVMPFIGFSGDADGKFRICCLDNYTREKGDIGNIKDMSVEQYWYSKELKKVRTSMLEGKKLPNCKTCYKKEKLGFISMRQSSNKKYHDEIPKIIQGLDMDTFRLQGNILYLDIRFSNICNLACRMCFSGSSSGRIELDKKLGRKDFLRVYSGIWNTDNFLESELLFKSLQELYIAGGEPLLDDDQYIFVQKLIDTGKSRDITLIYNTNLTVLPQKVLDIFRHFKLIKIVVSCDGYGKVYEYIRIGARWKDFLRNLICLRNFFDSNSEILSEIVFNIVLQRDNIHDIPKLCIFLRKLGSFHVNISLLTFPQYLSIENIPRSERKRLIILYEYFLSKHKNDCLDIERYIYPIIQVLRDSDPQGKYMKEYDKDTQITNEYVLEKYNGK